MPSEQLNNGSDPKQQPGSAQKRGPTQAKPSESDLAHSNLPRTVTNEELLSEYEQRVEAAGFDLESLRDRVQLDGCVSTNDFELFALSNLYFSSGEAFPDRTPRPHVPLGISSLSSAEPVWQGIADYLEQLGVLPLCSTLEPEAGAFEHLRHRLEQLQDSSVPQATTTDRGSEVAHISLQIEPRHPLLRHALELRIETTDLDPKIFSPLVELRDEFLRAVHEVQDGLDKLNEAYLATFSLYSNYWDLVLADSLRDTFMPHG